MKNLISHRLFPVLLMGLLGMDARGVAPGGTETEKKESKIEFSPELETKLREFFEKATEARQKSWAESMKADIAKMAKALGLDNQQVQKLEAVAGEASTLSCASWRKKVESFWRRQYSRQPEEQLIGTLTQMGRRMDLYLKNDYSGDYIRPQDHSAWLEGLKTVLTSEQLAAWEKAESERKASCLKEIGEFLKPLVERNGENFRRSKMIRANEIKFVLALSKERSEQIDALVNEFVAQASEAWRKSSEKVLFGMNEDRRALTMKGRGFFLSLDDDEMARQETLWADGLAKVLSAEEKQRLEGCRQERRSRGVRAAGQMLIAELDSKIAFTTAQRDQLREPAEKMASTITSLFPEGDEPVASYNASPALFFTAASKASDEELKARIDLLQLSRWRELCNPETKAGDKRNSALAQRISQKEDNEAGSNMEPEEVEKIISTAVQERVRTERKKVVSEILVKAEDVARIVTVNGETLERLQTAARGSAERAIEGWQQELERYLRSATEGGDGTTFRDRISNISVYQFSRQNLRSPSRSILDECISSELNQDQIGLWKKELDARAAYRQEAIAAFILSQFDRKVYLTSDQVAKLTPKVERILKEYSEDISRMFGYSFGGGWYLQGYSQMITFVGIPELEVKEILTKEQWDSWIGSNEYSMSKNYWQNVQRNHEQRVKEL